MIESVKLICQGSNATKIILILFIFYLKIALFHLGLIVHWKKNGSFHQSQQEPLLPTSQSHSSLWQGSHPEGFQPEFLEGCALLMTVAHSVSVVITKTQDMFNFLSFI